MCMDEYVIIICMLGESAAVSNNMREDALRSATDPKEKKKERSSKYVCEEQRPYGWWKTQEKKDLAPKQR